MKLEEGMFVRLDDIIARIITIANKKMIDGNDGVWFIFDKHKSGFYQNTTFKASHNLIDLIEVGDILTFKNLLGNTKKVEVDETFELLDVKQLYSIVTHEQFAQSEYKVGDGE